MSHTWVEISRSAVRHNLAYFQGLVGRQTAICPVIKSNAYGHGLQEISECIGSRASFVATASTTEALQLPKSNRHVLALSYLEKENLTAAIKRGVRLPVYGYDAAKTISQVSAKIGEKAYIHIKVDTGATRVGIPVAGAVSEIKKIFQLPHIVSEGIYSHFATADGDEKYMQTQNTLFQNVIKQLADQRIIFKQRHIACTGAILQKHSMNYTMARLGIGLYGLWPSAKLQKKSRLRLKPVLTWKTKIIDVKYITKGTSVGYGRSFIAKKPMRIAVLPVGYWEGYDRHLSNQGRVLIHGVECPVVGRVCMNLTMVDVTKVLRAKIGSEVTLLTPDQKHPLVTANGIAKMIGTINYEVTTRINPLIPRIIVS